MNKPANTPIKNCCPQRVAFEVSGELVLIGFNAILRLISSQVSMESSWRQQPSVFVFLCILSCWCCKREVELYRVTKEWLLQAASLRSAEYSFI